MIALTTAIGVLKGTNSEAFAVGLVFSLVVSATRSDMLHKRQPCQLSTDTMQNNGATLHEAAAMQHVRASKRVIQEA